MQLHEEIAIGASPDVAWAIVSDPHGVVDCVPGASITGRNEDGTFNVTLGVSFGPARIEFRGKVALELDEAARIGRVTAAGLDKLGGTRAHAALTFMVAPGPPLASEATAAGPGSLVAMRGEVSVSGPLASLIEGGAGIVIRRTSAEFAERLSAACERRQAALGRNGE